MVVMKNKRMIIAFTLIAIASLLNAANAPADSASSQYAPGSLNIDDKADVVEHKASMAAIDKADWLKYINKNNIRMITVKFQLLKTFQEAFDPTWCDAVGHGLLHLAVINFETASNEPEAEAAIGIAKLLLEHNVKINNRNHQDKTALDLTRDYSDMADFLRKKGALRARELDVISSPREVHRAPAIQTIHDAAPAPAQAPVVDPAPSDGCGCIIC